MLKTVSNGQSIHQYIPPHLRRMFYNNPAAVHASQNGKDPYGFSTDGLVLYLPLWALKDSAFKSIDPYRHSCSVTGATWGSQGRTFDGDDQISIPANAALNTANFSIGLWLKPDQLRVQGIASKDDFTQSWRLFMDDTAGHIELDAKSDASNLMLDDPMIVGVFSFVVFTYENPIVTAYLNGAYSNFDTVADYGNAYSSPIIISPTAVATFDGTIGEFFFYNRALSAGEVMQLYQATSWRYRS